jgi:glutamate--cysteine ligase
MSRDLDQSDELITSRDQLVAYFAQGIKPRAHRLVGTEHEKFMFRRDSGAMLTYEERGGFRDIFDAFAAQGWRPTVADGHIIALEHQRAALTLEPGGQFELSGAPLPTIHDTAKELDDHLSAVRALVGEQTYMVCWGVNPFFDLDQIPWMPKPRYGIMRRYLPTRGDLAHWMMKGTCTVQANFDYTSEADAADILRTGLTISPIISALFAASPACAGQDTGMQTFRCHIWTRTDPDRTGFPDFMLSDSWGFVDYVEYMLDVPMFFIRRDNAYIDMTGTPFRHYLEHGFQGHRATIGDFDLHLSTAFPELRMKRYIEVRGADAGPRDMLLALPAIWKGILYSEPAREAARALLPGITPEALRTIHAAMIQDGIHAQTAYGPMRELARRLVQIGAEGLRAIAAEVGHADEVAFLDPLVVLLERGQSVADRLREDLKAAQGDWRPVVERWAL